MDGRLSGLPLQDVVIRPRDDTSSLSPSTTVGHPPPHKPPLDRSRSPALVKIYRNAKKNWNGLKFQFASLCICLRGERGAKFRQAG